MVVSRSDALEETWRLHSGTSILLRALRPTDLPLHRQFLYDCSQESLYQRFFQVAEHAKVTDQQIARYTNFDQTRELAIIAVEYPQQTKELGVARLIQLGNGIAEFAVIVADPWQRQGLGRKLIEKIIEVAQQNHIGRLQGYVLGSNRAMIALCRQMGFKLCYLTGEGMYQVHLDLSTRRPSIH